MKRFRLRASASSRSHLRFPGNWPVDAFGLHTGNSDSRTAALRNHSPHGLVRETPVWFIAFAGEKVGMAYAALSPPLPMTWAPPLP